MWKRRQDKRDAKEKGAQECQSAAERTRQEGDQPEAKRLNSPRMPEEGSVDGVSAGSDARERRPRSSRSRSPPRRHGASWVLARDPVQRSYPSSRRPVQPAERQDIHKSCRTIETLLNVLTDYCEAASTFAAIHKKFAKALRDAAGSKTNAQSAGEVLADVDSKFAKIAQKECNNVSSEVKKWFKKLAVSTSSSVMNIISNCSAQGQAYEKKSKKGARDAGEEHARYINLLSVLGPEMSQEKYNHAVLVTQQHASTTFCVASSLSRIADAEWTRTCESMRRFSPTIGPLGEWRALCEGAWTGPLPDDLPEVSSTAAYPPPGPTNIPAVSEWGQTSLSSPNHRSLPIPPLGGHSPGTTFAHAAASLDLPRPAYSTNDQNQGSINSITTLSAFPFPPTHFPVPLAMNEAELQRQQMQIQSLQIALMERATSIETPTLLADSFKGPPSPQVLQTPSGSQHSHTHAPAQDTLADVPAPLPENKESGGSGVSAGDSQKLRRPSLIARAPPSSERPKIPPRPEVTVQEGGTFGVQPDTRTFKSYSVGAAKKNIEPTNSTTNNGSNVVAALRTRYGRTIDTPSQGPKDIPRLPMSVSEIASRYQPVDEPLRTSSPIVDRFPSVVETPTRQTTREMPIEDSEIRRRKQRIEELAELELMEKEFELRHRERELQQRTRDFERDRLQFLTSRPDPNSATDGPKGPRNSLSSTREALRATSHSPTRSQPTTPLPAKDHAPFCGCDTCSISKYRTADAVPSPRDLRPPEPPILLRPDKPKGWIRRLSMPSVNVAFSLDAKKNASAISLKSGLPLPSENGRLRKQSFEQGTSNRTVTGIGR
ncbi:hypothetical protein BU15DRAFT_86366 [Melanogaster broomeanus]|nr:hypothetical protein BU15DRAFT_86366 [Melanogaster broomeanus]